MKIDVTQFLQSFQLKIELFPLQILYPFAIGNNHFSRIWPEDQYTELSWSKDIHKWLLIFLKVTQILNIILVSSFSIWQKLWMIFPNWDPGFCTKECYVAPSTYLRVSIKLESRGFSSISPFSWAGPSISHWLTFTPDMEDLESKLEVEVLDNPDVSFMIPWKPIPSNIM